MLPSTSSAIQDFMVIWNWLRSHGFDLVPVEDSDTWTQIEPQTQCNIRLWCWSIEHIGTRFFLWDRTVNGNSCHADGVVDCKKRLRGLLSIDSSL